MLKSTGKVVQEMSLHIVEKSALTPIQVKHISRKFKRENPDLGLIVIDYLQLMRVPNLENNRVQEITRISSELKSLAKDLKMPVIAISQLNRGVDSRMCPKPRMSDLRDSGAIEQDADLIMFVYREEVYKPDEDHLKGRAELIIVKQRNGSIGEIQLDFQGKFCRFRQS